MQKGILHLSHSPTIGLTSFLQALPPSTIAVHLGLAILTERGEDSGGDDGGELVDRRLCFCSKLVRRSRVDGEIVQDEALRGWWVGDQA